MSIKDLYSFGKLNSFEERNMGSYLDVKNTNITDILRNSALERYSKKSFRITGPMKGIVLKALESYRQDSVWDNIFGDKKVISCKIRIPEIHSMLPIPSAIDSELIELYPTFFGKNIGVESLNSGNIVLVDYGDRENLRDPIILSFLDTGIPLPTKSKPSELNIENTANELAVTPAPGDAVSAGERNSNNQIPSIQSLEENSFNSLNVKTTMSNMSPPPKEYPDILTLAQLRLAMPSLNQNKANIYYPYLVTAMKEFYITTPYQKAAFLAVIALESGDLRYFEEIASGDAYEGRTSLGNTQRGDGRRYKGRGPIQLTGRSNYRAAGKDLKLPLEDDPQIALNLDIAFRLAGWFWKKNKIGPFADNKNFLAVSSIVNTGRPNRMPNGWEDRLKRYKRSLSALGLPL
jgi:predicted chitinase